MKSSPVSVFSCIILIILISFFCAASADSHDDFLQCLFQQSSNSTSIIFTQNDTSYFPVLNFSIQNPRFSSPSTPKPVAIITPLNASHVQATIYCSKKYGFQIRVRSGGHDYEGLSYVSDLPFVLIDLVNLRSVNVDLEGKSAWVEAGATIGEVYYNIAQKSQTLGFPSAIAHTVGVGGLFSGGGYGAMLRKNLEQNVTKLVHRWQFVANKFDDDLFILVRLQAAFSTNGDGNNNRTIQASFISLFLGGVDRLLPLMNKSFPELGMVREDCTEMSWIESVIYFAGFPSGVSREVLLDRTTQIKVPVKAKSDYVKVPVPVNGLEGIWERLFEEDVGRALMQMTPYGGRMNEIPEWETPFPHRAGNIYKILYVVAVEEGNGTESVHINWIRRLYSYMTPFVSKNPREAYLNYRDLDIGRNNNNGTTSNAQASIWGFKYFKSNFNRLVRVKTIVDPDNFFRNEQSIPCLPPL
ncbi:Glycolate oxidase subunit [Trema orientale]|uniref:Glycolate oxidase subunit n=1 Tax=Trema orientale TaxID=63057 RepID=A0A2P5ENU6_TREOI|nr:Glycolate oxidase subunit [Trema orientale]